MKDKVHGMVLAGLVAGLVALAWQRDTHTRAAPGEPTETRIDKKERTMTVSGTAKVRFSPDSARIFFGVESTAPTVKEARSQTNQRLAKVMDAIRDLKIDGIKMKTSDVRVDAVHEHRRENGVDRTVHVGYKVAVSFTVLAQHGDANQLGTNAGRILDTGLDNGANVVQRIAFFKEKWRQHQREAMTKAVEDALENARAMAAGAKVTLVGTTTIHGLDETGWGGGPNLQNVQVMNARGGDSSTPIVAGDLEVTYRVSVVCAY